MTEARCDGHNCGTMGVLYFIGLVYVLCHILFVKSLFDAIIIWISLKQIDIMALFV